MIDEIQKNETAPEVNTSESTPADTAAPAPTTDNFDEKLKALNDHFEALSAKIAEKEKQAEQKEKLNQVQVMEEKLAALTKQLEEQQDMNASTRVDGASTVPEARNTVDVSLNFKTLSEADWTKNSSIFLKQYYNING